MSFKINLQRFFINLYPPYLGTGISIRSISPDHRHVVVRMKMHWYNRNYVKTHFGGSLYAMTDPIFMLMLIHILGRDYIVWDKAAHIDFIKPGKGTVTARFDIDDTHLENILKQTRDGQKHLEDFEVRVVDGSGDTIAHIIKTLYIRKKPNR
ncbi:MAG: DUF4442 domain-containing protein [Calditrichales bacterium]|nr:MAG: DUF4442 domain-containing protein [Calditrichales bacterium]